MFHQTPSRSLTLLSCENQPAFRISPLILYSVRTARYGLQQTEDFDQTGYENHLTDVYRVHYSLKPVLQLVDVKSRHLTGHLWSRQEEFLSHTPLLAESPAADASRILF